HWITPIPPPNETLAANPIGSSRVRAQGWAAILDPWKAAHPEIGLVHHIAAFDDLTPQQLAAAKSGSPADVAYTDAGRTLGEAAKATWNERPGLDSIRYLARLAQNYASPGAAVAEDAALLQNWLSGQTAMLLAGPELTAEIDPSALPYGVQSVPAYIQGQASS